jgi:capsular polysaccharide transport system permease protein
MTITPISGPPPIFKVHKRPFASFRTISALILREMATSYGRSPGGYIWAILEPVAGIALLSLVFSVALRHPAIGNNFALFYATGIIPFSIFNNLANKLAQSINFSRPLLTYPSVTFLDAILARFILNFLTEIMVSYIIFTGILMLFDTHAILNIPAIAMAIGLAGCLALGIGTLNCYLFTQFPLWQQAWSIVMRPMFIISCVFIVFDSIPPMIRDWLWYNPVVHLVGLMRRGFYSSYDAPYVSVLYLLGISAITLMIGLMLLRRDQQKLLNG